MASFYHLLSENYFSQYEGEAFLEKIKQRIKYEKSDDIKYQNSGISFWPEKDKQCLEKNYDHHRKNKNCSIGFDDIDKDYLIKIKDKEYKRDLQS